MPASKGSSPCPFLRHAVTFNAESEFVSTSQNEASFSSPVKAGVGLIFECKDSHCVVRGTVTGGTTALRMRSYSALEVPRCTLTISWFRCSRWPRFHRRHFGCSRRDACTRLFHEHDPASDSRRCRNDGPSHIRQLAVRAPETAFDHSAHLLAMLNPYAHHHRCRSPVCEGDPIETLYSVGLQRCVAPLHLNSELVTLKNLLTEMSQENSYLMLLLRQQTLLAETRGSELERLSVTYEQMLLHQDQTSVDLDSKSPIRSNPHGQSLIRHDMDLHLGTAYRDRCFLSFRELRAAEAAWESELSVKAAAADGDRTLLDRSQAEVTQLQQRVAQLECGLADACAKEQELLGAMERLQASREEAAAAGATEVAHLRQRVGELQGQLCEADSPLRSPEELHFSDCCCSFSCRLHDEVASLTMRLDSAMTELNKSSLSHNGILRRSASALHEMQRQLADSREREATASRQLYDVQQQLQSAQTLISEFVLHEKKSEVAFAFHVEAAQLFLLQVQALQRRGEVCGVCRTRLSSGS